MGVGETVLITAVLGLAVYWFWFWRWGYARIEVVWIRRPRPRLGVPFSAAWLHTMACGQETRIKSGMPNVCCPNQTFAEKDSCALPYVAWQAEGKGTHESEKET
jgi:hypothetical protein